MKILWNGTFKVHSTLEEKCLEQELYDTNLVLYIFVIIIIIIFYYAVAWAGPAAGHSSGRSWHPQGGHY